MPPSKGRPVLEITAVIVTGATYLLFENVFDLKLPFLAVCFVAWAIYVAPRMWRDAAARREWGFRLDTLAPSALACAAFLAVAGGAILAWRASRGWLPIPSSTALLFLVYPVWGLAQQFFIQSLVAANLRRLGVGTAVIVPVSAILFGLAHYPDRPLMALCAGAGLVWTGIFLKWPNVVPLALTHAWLGSLAYLLVLERNPWAEMNLPG